jgi:hypothetical protein
MSELTKEQCEEIRGREKLATAGPWEWWRYEGDKFAKLTGGKKPPKYVGPWTTLARIMDGDCLTAADKDFIACSRYDIPALLDTVASLRAKLEDAKGALKYYAEKKTYYCTVYDPASGEMVAPVLADDGARARAAIAKLEAKQ